MENICSFDIKNTPVEGLNLIEASAGTGKTYTITGLFLRYILENKISHDKILVVTFTEAATKELKERIRGKLKEVLNAFSENYSDDPFIYSLVEKYNDRENSDRLKDTVNAFDQVQIYTIHGFCRKILLENAFESQTLFDAEITQDQSHLLGQIADDFYRINFQEISLYFAEYLYKKGLNPEYFKKLLISSAGKESFKILPKISDIDFLFLEDEYEVLFEEVKNIWIDNKRTVGTILLESSSLNRNKYRLNTIKKLLFLMDSFFDSGVSVSLFDGFEKFTEKYLKTAVKKGQTVPENPFFQAASELYDKSSELLILYDKKVAQLKRKIVSEGLLELEKIKQERNVIGFDDLLLNMKKALESSPLFAENIAKKFKVALIDEFQDTDPVQYEIFKRIFFKRCDVFLIGDPKQAIYSFRGADIYSYKNAFSDAENIYTLKTNFRSDRGLVESVNSIFRNHKTPFFFEWIDYKDVDSNDDKNSSISPLKIWFFESGSFTSGKSVSKDVSRKIIGERTAGEIVKITSGGNSYKKSDIAVLVRTNFEAEIYKEILSDHGIKSVIHSNSNVFDTKEALEISRILKAVAEPDNRNRIKTALSTEIMGYSLKEIVEIDGSERKWEKISASFKRYSIIWKRNGFTKMIKEFLSGENIISRVTALKNGERKSTNILHIAEILNRNDYENKGAEQLVKWLDDMRDPTSDRGDEGLLRLSGDENLIKIVTIHKSKGMEYPVVFVPSLYKETVINDKESHFFFHGPANDFFLDLGSGERDQNIKRAFDEVLAENLRLAYVAVTRAKERCYLAWGKLGKYASSSLSYLFHGEGEKNFIEIAEKMTSREMIKDLEKLKSISDGNIDIEVISELPPFEVEKVKSLTDELKLPYFSSHIDNSFGVSSFSSISSHGKSFRGDDFSYLYDDNTKRDVSDIFSFPKGNVPGLFMHEILEEIDYSRFDADSELIISEKLEKYGYEEKWLPTVLEMVKTLIYLELDDSGLSLSKIDTSKRINEMEFYFPVSDLLPEKLENLLNGARELNFSRTRGFLKGYIDLIINYRGRFYILDWKSNHLGNSKDEYCVERLKEAIEDNYYDLQYYIYSVALHKYLRRNLIGYNYNENFGGVFYIFLRGIEKGKETGVFRENPPLELIEAYEKALSGDLSI